MQSDFEFRMTEDGWKSEVQVKPSALNPGHDYVADRHDYSSFLDTKEILSQYDWQYCLIVVCSAFRIELRMA
jgi:hypothetical protein